MRKLSNGGFRTLLDVLQFGSHIYFREAVACMNREIFALWAREFVLETEDLRIRKENLLIILDGFTPTAITLP